MDEPGIDATQSAVAHLRREAGGSNPWTETGPSRCRGGFAWRDDHGNQFDVTISLFRAAPRTQAEREAERARDAWQTVLLGDDSACITDPDSWRRALECRSRAP